MDPDARRRLPVPASWLRPSPASLRRQVARSVALGTLVLFTVWGFGRSAAPDDASWFLLAGVVSGVVVAGLGLRGARRPPHGTGRGGHQKR